MARKEEESETSETQSWFLLVEPLIYHGNNSNVRTPLALTCGFCDTTLSNQTQPRFVPQPKT